MNRNDIIRIAQEAGLHIATDVHWMPIIGLEYAEKFAALVIANHPPQSFMTWQVGYEEGKQTEREACAQMLEAASKTGKIISCTSAAKAIRARGDKHD